MRKRTITALMAAPLLLTGCTSMGNDGLGPLGGVLGSVLGGGLGGIGGILGGGDNYGYGNSGQQFQQAAINACGQQAARYGRVGISDVRQVSNSTLRVYGQIAMNNYQTREFNCDFRSDGRITDFDLD